MASTATAPVALNFDNGELWTAWVDYNGTTLEVRVASNGVRPAAPTLTYDIDIPDVVGASAWVGFTAATGGAYGNHDIVSWSFSTSDGMQDANLLDNDSDPEDDELTIASYTQPANGTVVVHADGTFTYTPTAGYTGPDSFTYTVEDGHGNSSTATVHITVTGPTTG